MAVREITFKCTKASTYYTIGGVRIYDSNGNIYPIKFSSKNSLTTNTFYIQGTDITGTVSVTNSYGGYYFVDSPFDTDKSIVTSYPNYNYWLSSSADTIKISFDKGISIEKIDFVPYSGNGADRKNNAVEIIVTDEYKNTLLQEIYNTSSYVENQVYSALTPSLSYHKNMLLISNSKTYSLESINTWYQTNMTANNAPSPLVASASSEYSTVIQAWRAFDGKISRWESKGNGEAWIQINFGKVIKVNKMTLRADGTYPERTPKTFEIQCSNDGVSFVTISSITDEKSWSKGESREYHFNNNKGYSIYRLRITSNFNNATNMVDEIVFGYETMILQTIPFISKENFIKYGENSLSNINKIITNKNYLLQDELSKNSDGLWTTTLDRKPLSIGFN